VAVYAALLYLWWRSGFGPLFHERPAIVAVVAMAVGGQIIATSFFGSLLGLKKAELRENADVLRETSDVALAAGR